MEEGFTLCDISNVDAPYSPELQAKDNRYETKIQKDPDSND